MGAINACQEAAQRINVVVSMLEEHVDNCVPPKSDGHGRGTGGYELSIMRDVLEAIRDLLWDAVNDDKAPEVGA
jgi:hypothetical protein